jgi:hypothetical protein
MITLAWHASPSPHARPQCIVQSPEYMPENTLRCVTHIRVLLCCLPCVPRTLAICATLMLPLLAACCRYAPFIGGAILAKTVFPQNQHITKHDYHEFGPSVVSRRAT